VGARRSLRRKRRLRKQRKRSVPSCSNFDTISFASVFQPERREVSLPTPRLRTPRTMLRAVLVVALALGAADAARPLGGAPTPAPTSPIVLGLCDCAFEAYGGCVLGDSTLVRAGRE
jgi:hypothetical protein